MLFFIPDALDQFGGGDVCDEITDKPCGFDQCCLRVVQIENASQMGSSVVLMTVMKPHVKTGSSAAPTQTRISWHPALRHISASLRPLGYLRAVAPLSLSEYIAGVDA